MERIREAIEKARSGRTETKTAAPPARIKRESNQPKALSDISYDQTQVIMLDPDVLEANRIVANTKSDARSSYFDILRTQILQKMRAKDLKTLAITSPTASCGKSLIAINLAYSIAQNTSDSVLLVDFDLRRPSIAKYLGFEPSPSLFDFLQGDAELKDVFVNPSVPRLLILPNHRPIINASETLASKTVSDMIDDMGKRYPERVVIFDLPPLLSVDDAVVMLPNVDASLLVVAAGESRPKDIKEARRLLKGHTLLGTVMNKSDAKIVEYY